MITSGSLWLVATLVLSLPQSPITKVTPGLDAGLPSFSFQADSTRPISPKDDGFSVAFSPDGKLLAWIAGQRGTTSWIRFWDLKANKILRSISFTNELGAIRIVFSPDSKVLASADGNRCSVRLWDTSTGKLLKDLKAPDEMVRVTSASFSADGTNLIAGGDLAKALVWDLKSGKLVTSFKTEDSTDNLVVTPDWKWVITGAWLGAKVWDITSGEKVWDIQEKTAKTDALFRAAVAVSPNRYLVAVGTTQTDLKSAERVIDVWDFQKRSLLYSIRAPAVVSERSPHRLAFSPDGESLASITPQGQVALWNIATQKVARTIEVNGVQDMVYSVDGKTLALAAFNSNMKDFSDPGGGIHLCPVKPSDKK